MADSLVSQTGWEGIQSSLASLKDLLDACYTAWGPDDQKVSVTTKKRLAVRALKGLEHGQELLKVLTINLQKLEQSSKQWELNVVQASRSHKDLVQQLEHTSDDLHSSNDRLRHAEADRLAAQCELQQLQQQLAAAQEEKDALTATINQLEHDLQAANFGANEANAHLSELRAQVDQLAVATKQAEEGAAAAAGAVSAAQQEAQKERAARKRHEDAVARLTADNLVFMAKLRAAESAAEAATAERDELLLALEAHKGPWMDEVHRSVEQRVKAALTRAEQLEQQQEQAAKQTAEQMKRMQQQQADLEAELAAATDRLAELNRVVSAARAAEGEARLAAEEAQALAADAQATADERAAELRVAQDSLKNMREECNERWMSERTARAQLAEQQSQLAAAEADIAQLKKSVQSKSDELLTQRAVNQQLMMKKEEVEWQLMAAIAKLKSEEAQNQSSSPASSTHLPMSPLAARNISCPNTINTGRTAAQAFADIDAAAAAIRVCDSVSAPGLPPSSPAPSNHHHQQQRRLSSSGSVTIKSPAAAAAGGSVTRRITHPGYSNSAVAPLSPMSPKPDLPYDTFSALEAAASAKSPFSMLASGPFAMVNSVPDMFALPSLSYGLATLPPPELLAAVASGQLGRAASASVAAASSSSFTGTMSPVASIRTQGVVVGATGGLMAPFSPLVRKPRNSLPPSSPTSIGAVFPACATACAVTDAEQMDSSSLSSMLPSLAPGQQQQQQWVAAEAPAGAQDSSSDRLGQHHRKAGPHVGDASAAGTAAVASSSPRGVPHSPLAAAGVAGGARVLFSGHPVHPLFATPTSSPGTSPTAAAAAATAPSAAVAAELAGQCLGATPAAAAAAAGAASMKAAEPGVATADRRGSSDVATGPSLSKHLLQQQQQHDVASSNASSSNHPKQLHGILLNGPNSKPRSRSPSPAPSRGVSPSHSMKSVRFSFENLDQNLEGQVIEHNEPKPCRRSLDSQRDERQIRDDSHSHTARRSLDSSRCHDAVVSYGSSSSSSRHHSHGAVGYRSDPRSMHVGVSGTSKHDAASELEDLFSSIRADAIGSPLASPTRATKHQDLTPWMLQQRREQAKAAAVAAAAARQVAAAAGGHVGDLPVPKRPPVHPVFGTMAWSGGSNSSSPTKAQ